MTVNTTPDLEQLCEQVIAVVRPVGDYMREQRRRFNDVEIAKKGVRDFVTAVDLHAERTLVQKLRDILPEAGYVTEEKTVEQYSHTYNWIIDPLDGTMNYVHGIPVYSISVALQHAGKIVLGVVYEVAHDEMFYAWEGSPAYCNGELIRISGCQELSDALIATGFPYIRHDARTRAIADTLKYFLDHGRDIRRLGTAATDLCYVACGRLDVYYEGFLNIWDIAAGVLIVQQAGGVAVNFKGEKRYSDGTIVASGSELLPAVLSGIQF